MLGLLSLVDTPGVLSGDKQRVGRSYDFEGGRGRCQNRNVDPPRMVEFLLVFL